MSTPRARPGAILLVGGRSRRMGRPKAWLPAGSETLLGRMVRLLDGVAGPLVVVAAEGQDLPPIPGHVAVARDPIPDRGPLAGLAAGMEAIEPGVELVYATGVDTPFLQPGWIDVLIAAIAGVDLAIPEVGGYLQPLAALYRRRTVLPVIRTILQDGGGGPTDLAGRVATVRVGAETMRSVDPELATLRNLNTPEAYRIARIEHGWAAPEDGCPRIFG